jgi:NAD(P)-dependent dehydrogenase (short-subunit alcohol dehydrogenase family)
MQLFDLTGRSPSSPVHRAASAVPLPSGWPSMVRMWSSRSRKQDACDEVAAAINARYGAGRAIAQAASISSKEALQALVERTNHDFGRIDVLVCNAASNPYYGPMAGISDEQFRKILTTTCSATTG